MDPPLIIKLTEATAVYFKKVVDLKKIAADVTIFFPQEFENANAKQIRREFIKVAKEAEE